MEINIDEINVCVINLPKHVERLERTHKELTKFYSDSIYGFHYHLIEGVIDTQPNRGIAQAHMNCIQMAKDNNWPFVVVCEDDLQFQSPKSKEYAIEAFKNAPEDFDILLGGIYTSTGLKRYNAFWNQTGEFSATHYYLVHSRAYDTILAFDRSQHIDRWYARKDNLKCYVTDKFFAIQYPGYSDNVGCDVDYTAKLRKFKLL